MMYEEVIADFAQRTAANLNAIRAMRARDSKADVYEVTQLVNSMLGLLVFPQQRYMDRIPETSIAELERDGWPIPSVIGDYPQVKDLRELVRMLRNAVTHCNLEFQPGPDSEIQRLYLWNTHPRTHAVTWKAEMMVADLDGITQKFIELLLNKKAP